MMLMLMMMLEEEESCLSSSDDDEMIDDDDVGYVELIAFVKRKSLAFFNSSSLPCLYIHIMQNKVRMDGMMI